MITELNPLVVGEKTASRALAEQAGKIYMELVELLGFVKEEKADEDDFIKEIEALIEERAEAKKAKNYARADEIRNYLAEKGVTLLDTRQGTQYKIG